MSKYSVQAALGGGHVVVESLFIVVPIICGGSVFGPCFVIQYFVLFKFCYYGDRE